MIENYLDTHVKDLCFWYNMCKSNNNNCRAYIEDNLKHYINTSTAYIKNGYVMMESCSELYL